MAGLHCEQADTGHRLSPVPEVLLDWVLGNMALLRAQLIFAMENSILL